MRIGDIISLPVHPAMPKAFWSWADAKVVGLHSGGFIEFEFIAGEKDGALFATTPEELDRMLGREGGEEWKTEGGA